MSETGTRRLRFVMPAVGILAGFLVAWFAYRQWTHFRLSELRSHCEASLEAGNWSALERSATEWAEAAPESGDAWLALAEAYRQSGNLQKTADCLDRVPREDERVLTALAMRAELLFAGLNRPLEAVATWEEMLELDASADVARQRLIYFHAMTLQRRPMLEQIRTAMRLHCEPRESYTYLVLANSLQFRDGPQHLARWLQEHPNDEHLRVAYAIHVDRAARDGHNTSGGTGTDEETGRKLVDACARDFPDNLELTAYLTELAIAAADQHEVARRLAAAPDRAASDNRFWRYRGWLLSMRGDLEQAEAAYRRTLELHPYAWRARHELADVLRRQNRHADAEEESRLALAGKRLSQELFELPNPSRLDDQLLVALQQYAMAVEDREVVDALEFRAQGPVRRVPY